jgi:hypothetical protein
MLHLDDYVNGLNHCLAGIDPLVTRFGPFGGFLAAVTFIAVVIMHSRMREASALRDYVEDHGWRLLKNGDIIPKDEWDELRAAGPQMSYPRNFISGNWRGTEFLMFEGPGVGGPDRSSIGGEAIIGFRKTRSARPGLFSSAIFNTESSGWRRYESENWLFLSMRNPLPLFKVPVGDLAGFAEKATTLFHQVYG